MTTVAGLDLALRATGYATLFGFTETLTPPRDVVGYGRHNWLAGKLVTRLNLHRPDVVILEDYAPSSFGVNSTIASAEVGGIIRATLARGGIDWLAVKPNSLKLYATGDGRASKVDMIDAAHRAGAVLSSSSADNEADAWLLRHVGLAALGVLEPLGKIPASLAGIATIG